MFEIVGGASARLKSPDANANDSKKINLEIYNPDWKYVDISYKKDAQGNLAGYQGLDNKRLYDWNQYNPIFRGTYLYDGIENITNQPIAVIVKVTDKRPRVTPYQGYPLGPAYLMHFRYISSIDGEQPKFWYEKNANLVGYPLFFPLGVRRREVGYQVDLFWSMHHKGELNEGRVNQYRIVYPNTTAEYEFILGSRDRLGVFTGDGIYQIQTGIDPPRVNSLYFQNELYFDIRVKPTVSYFRMGVFDEIAGPVLTEQRRFELYQRGLLSPQVKLGLGTKAKINNVSWQKAATQTALLSGSERSKVISKGGSIISGDVKTQFIYANPMSR